MKSLIDKFKSLYKKCFNCPNLNKAENRVLLVNIVLVSLLIAFNNLEITPLRKEELIFFGILFFILFLLRPVWGFLLFIGTIPLENINLAPETFDFSIKPYQFIAAFVVLSTIIRLIFGKLNFKLQKIRWFDLPVILMNVGGILSLLNAPNREASMKLVIIFFSFSVLYFLVRNFIQNFEDVRRVFPFFVSSSLIVVVYGIWQNLRFVSKLPTFEVMLGRPNSTFAEPDWLGIYLAFLISFIYVGMHAILCSHNDRFVEDEPFKLKHLWFLFLSILLFLSYILLIIIVTRSAWFGTLMATLVFLFAIFTQFKLYPEKWQWAKTIEMKLIIFSIFFVAASSVYYFDLTNFQIFNRVQSTASGLQKITVSCEDPIFLPERIDDIKELDFYKCKHINLEEKNVEKLRGNYVTEIYRLDPNIKIREEVYMKSLEEIKKHPFLGIGWGSISDVLGSDDQGEKLNSSNIFLQIWLGSGFLGFASFLFALSYLVLTGIRKYYYSTGEENRAIALFLLVSSVAIVIPNLFNAGVFLGFLWVWLAVAMFLAKISNNL